MDKMTELVNFCKSNGFIFPGSEIYDGLANTWDFGPLGVLFKNNIKKEWFNTFVSSNKSSYGIDAAILMNPRVWEASGHTSSFSDPLMDCKSCGKRHRADKLIEEFTKGDISGDGMSNKELMDYIVNNNIVCPSCKKLNYTDIRNFNLMFETNRGVTEGSLNTIYLRPETAQGQYVNFLNVQRSMRAKVPFGIGQIGKAFRNEITPGNFIFRTIEFEQMEHQWFCHPSDDTKYYDLYKEKAHNFLTGLGINEDNIRFKDHEKLAHYAKAACDIEYNYYFGFSELNGTHNRTDFDLKNHMNHSGKKLEYLDPTTNEKYIPYVIESTVGADRLALALLTEAYVKEQMEDGEIREVLKLSPKVAPYKVSVLPLIKKIHEDKASEVFELISSKFSTSYDDTANIGKRYRRADSIGTPLCITIDDETINNHTVTIRNRDTMKQDIIKVDDIISYINTFLDNA